jgi:outer membrane protein assembly factor BamD
MVYKNLLAWLLILGVSSSCVLQKTSTGLAKYQQAVLCYEAGNYNEALRFFEEATPLIRGKKEEASAYFYRAHCSFYQRKYVPSSDRFEYFYKTFPRDHRVEEAMYMRGHALYSNSPDVKLDQAYTQEAAEVLRNYLNAYPQGVYVNKANVQLRELNGKLTLKAFNSAKLYHQLTHYRAAVITLENFQKDFPDSSYNEEAAYLKADAQYCYCKAMAKTRKRATGHDRKNSDKGKVDILEEDEWTPQHGDFKSEQEADYEDQLRIAIAHCQEFLDNYPSSRRALAVGNIYKSLLLVNKPEKPLKR